METRRMVMALVVAMAVFFAWQLIAQRIFPAPKGRGLSDAARTTSRPTTQVGAKEAQTTGGPTSGTSTGPGGREIEARAGTNAAGTPALGATPAPGGKTVQLRAVEAVPHTVTLGNDDPNSPFRLMLKLSSRGGAVEDADLTPLLPRYRNYPKGDLRANENAAKDPFDSFDLLRPITDKQTGMTYRSMSTGMVNIWFTTNPAPVATKPSASKPGEESSDGIWQDIDISDRDWQIERRHEKDRDVATCSLAIEADGKPILRIVKTYVLFQDSYDVQMDVRLESLDGRPHKVILTQNGPIDMREIDTRSADSRKIYFGTRVGQVIKTGRVERKETVVEKKVDGRSVKTATTVDLTGRLGGTLVWAALGNQYFAAIMTPVNANREADLSAFKAVMVEHATSNTGANEFGDLTFNFVSSPTMVAPDKPARFDFDLYLGPKERSRFKDTTAHKNYVDRNYLGTIQEEYQWCVWTPLAELMSSLLIGLHRWVWPHNWGLAIIILVLVVRVILHPLTKKSQIGMSRMQVKMVELQPKIDEVKKKYANDKTKMNQEMMALYRKEGVNPAGNMMSCLPMLLQMPIWIALWASLSNTIELRHASFMIIPGRWILDLAAPDAIYRFAKPVPLLFFEIDAINVLPFLWGFSMILQQKFTPKPSSGRSTEQLEQQQRMMYIMSVVMTIMFYNFPSGLTLYIMASNFIGLAEQWRIRKHLEADKAAMAAAVPTGEGSALSMKPKGWFGSLMEKVEKFDQQQRAIKSGKKK